MINEMFNKRVRIRLKRKGERMKALRMNGVERKKRRNSHDTENYGNKNELAIALKIIYLCK